MPSYLSPGVYMEEVSAGPKPIEGVGTSTAAFVGFAEKGPVNQATLVTSWPQYTRTFGEFVEGAYLPLSVFSWFMNGGGNCYIVRVGANAEQEQAQPAASPKALPQFAEATLTGAEGKPALTVRTTVPASEARNVEIEIGDASENGEENFRLMIFQDNNLVENYDNVALKRGPNNVATALKASKLLTATDVRAAAVQPARGRTTLVAPEAPAAVPAPVEDATVEITPDVYVGDVSDRTGLGSLEALEDVTMLIVPDAVSAYESGAIDAEGLKAIQLAMIAHCELMGDRVAILDTPPGLNAQQVKEWRMNFTNYDSKYATMYWPWVKMMDPGSGKTKFVPPSGAIGGIWARTDATRGVHKAPANEIVRGGIALELNITKGEHDTLNPVGINCIREFPGQGMRVWGARTLSSDPEWRYLNVRRLFNFVEKSILLGTNWVVFEPNDPALWDRVGRTIDSFLRRVWQSGALFGASPSEAYFVLCNESNNPPENRDAGILTVEIGLSPVKPAEFVVFRLSQMADGAAMGE